MDYVQLMEFFPYRIAEAIRHIDFETIQEIRLRIGQRIKIKSKYHTQIFDCIGEDPRINESDCKEFFDRICFHSVYACEEQLRSGYLTLPGGFRIGFAGKILQETGTIYRVDAPKFFCIRIPHECTDCAKPIMSYLTNTEGYPLSTLMIGPPGCGKTTLLRDIARNYSYGKNGILSRQVCVIDERSEIGGANNGIPQLDLGPRCDLLDNSPKTEGIQLALRALAPEVLILDELGTEEDYIAVSRALSSGCAVYATMHGDSLDAFQKRFPKDTDSPFSRYILLSRRNGAGTVEGVFDQTLHPIAKFA